jgi:vacuolar-type H+-ATPase subunit I/STV1
LFGVMFGDMGHGLIILLIGILLVVFNNNLKGGAMDAVL